MSKETLLKKDFKESDLSRIRNIIEGKLENNTKTQVGYNFIKIKRKEGDIFEEDGKQYIIKDGIKQSYTKLDEVKKLFHFPLKCPNCSKAMKDNPYNRKMYKIHRICFDCVLEKETKLKLEGNFGEYEKQFLKNNTLSHIKEFELVLDEYINSNKETFMTEDGDEEKWIGSGLDKDWVKSTKEYLDELKKSL